VQLQSLRPLALAAALSVATLSAQAALVSRAGGMVYDTVQNITWLQNWNTNGRMDWTTANNWANNLVFGGFDDWRLPTSLNADGTGPCSGYNCTSSEMGHMFYDEFGATAGNTILVGANAANLALFTNVQSDVYWSGSEYAPNPDFAWNFLTFVGLQDYYDKNLTLYAVAVRPGDVAASVPEPQTLALALLALGATVVVRRRRPV
jgi:MYXO-CTERM domain-containing protein